jgi:hypothetical protein
VSAPVKSVYLIAPGYRRWITPDATELVFETEGFAPNESKLWQANLTVRDLDSDAQTHSTTPIDLSRKTFTLPVPKFHRRAEIILFIEDRRREPVAEGRWKLTNIPKDELPGLSYFDSRGVFFHEGVGRFPLIADARSVAAQKWKSLAEAGFTGLLVDEASVDDPSASLATSLKLLVFAVLKRGSLEANVRSVRRLQRYSAVAGYFASLESDPNALRAVDPTRPTLDFYRYYQDGDKHGKPSDFQDLILLWHSDQRRDSPSRPSCLRSGRTHFALLKLSDQLLSGICYSAARGAGGVFIETQRVNVAEDKSVKVLDVNPSEFVQPLKDATPVVNAVVRGTPLPSDDSTDDHWFWRRRLPSGERAVIEVKRGEPPTATFKIEKTEN